VLPVVEQAAERVAEDREQVPRGNECVLFVDDETDIIRMASHLLASLGYDPIVCSGPRDALNVMRRDPAAIDILVTDQVMPDMAGTQLAAEARALKADLPVILCSGFSETISPEQAAFSGIVKVLGKPVARKTLATAIRQALDAAAKRPKR
jgi:DNA-binding NtrC family response regulator